MISLRYHILTIASVFLALAIGVVLGSTALSGRLLSGLAEDKSSLGQQVNDLQAERNTLNARLADNDRFGTAVGPMVVKDQLAGRTIALITTADAAPADRDAVRALLTSAGAKVTGELQLTGNFTDPTKTDELRALIPRVIPAGVQLPTAGDAGTLAGGLLGPIMLLNPQDNRAQAAPAGAAAALSTLSQGGFVRLGQQPQPAQLAVIVTGGALTGDGAGDRAATIARFATQLRRSGVGAVLAGRTGSASGTGPVGVVRADSAATSVLSTVDDVDSAAGRAVTVLALREQLDGHAGRYGTGGNAQAPMPGPSTS